MLPQSEIPLQFAPQALPHTSKQQRGQLQSSPLLLVNPHFAILTLS